MRLRPFHPLHHVLHHVLEHLERIHHLILVGLVWVTTKIHLDVILILYIENTKLWSLIVWHLVPICIEVESLDLRLPTCSITDGHRLSESTGLAIVRVILH